MSTIVPSSEIVSSPVVPHQEVMTSNTKRFCELWKSYRNESFFIGLSDDESEYVATAKQDFIESQQETDIRKELIRKNLTKEEMSVYILKCTRDLASLEKEYRIAKENKQAIIEDQRTTNEDNYELHRSLHM